MYDNFNLFHFQISVTSHLFSMQRRKRVKISSENSGNESTTDVSDDASSSGSAT